MLNNNTLLSTAKKAVNQAVYLPTAERKRAAIVSLQALLDMVSNLDEVKPKASKPTSNKVAKRLASKAKPKRTTAEAVADKQEIQSSSPKGIAVNKADKAKAAQRVAKQQAEVPAEVAKAKAASRVARDAREAAKAAKAASIEDAKAVKAAKAKPSTPKRKPVTSSVTANDLMNEILAGLSPEDAKVMRSLMAGQSRLVGVTDFEVEDMMPF